MAKGAPATPAAQRGPEPEKASDWINKGIALYNEGKYDETIQAFDKAIKINPQDDRAWYAKGKIFCERGKYDEAIQAFDKVIEINPQGAKDAWINKGLALKALGRTKEAHAAFANARGLGYIGPS